MGNVMCKQKVVLETIKKTKGSGRMSAAQIKLAESQAEDYQEMKREILGIKQELGTLADTVDEVKVKQNYIAGQVDLLVQNSNSKTSHFFQFVLELIKIIIELIHTKSFWTLAIIVSVLYLCGKYNINPADLFKHLFGG